MDREVDKKRQIAREQVLADLTWLLTQPQGRRALKRFFVESRKRSFAGENTHATSYAEGRMDLAREVLDDLRHADLNLYQAAERESLEDRHA